MIKKIIFVNIFSLLLIGSIFGGAVKTNQSHSDFILAIESFNGNDAELPVWKNGDSWTYDMAIQGSDNSDDIAFDISFFNLKFTVTSDTGDVYKISFNGDFSGSGSYKGVLSGQIYNGKIAGVEYVNKSSLSIKKLEDVHITGKISVLDFDVDINNLFFNPEYAPIKFPLNVGDTWNVPTNVMTLDGYINKPGLVSGDLSLELHAGGYTASCEKKENKQGYNALKIIQNKTNSWYAPDAGNVVYAKNTGNIKLFMWGMEDYYFEITFFEMKLTDTNFEGPNNPPNMPEKPSGESLGYAHVVYSYETSAIDPDGNNVKYGFDWGDGSEITWTSFVESGETASANHKYTSEGTYEIRAKAQDKKGLESNWSEPLTVNISANNIPDKPSINGPTSGKKGETLTFIAVTIDADEDKIYYMFDWGDGKNSGWLGPKNTGEEITASHAWLNEDNYIVKVRAKDEHGALSEWSDPLSVSIPRNRIAGLIFNGFFYRGIEKFPNLERIFIKLNMR